MYLVNTSLPILSYHFHFYYGLRQHTICCLLKSFSKKQFLMSSFSQLVQIAQNATKASQTAFQNRKKISIPTRVGKEITTQHNGRMCVGTANCDIVYKKSCYGTTTVVVRGLAPKIQIKDCFGNLKWINL